MKRTIFHIDVNSAYLSWEAVDRLQHGEKLDIRTIPSIIGGDVSKRHGIVLAKSMPAKPFNIQTGETLYSAKQKCPNLFIAPPRYDLYMRASNSMFELLSEYTDKIQRYSIDENFLDVTDVNTHLAPFELAEEMRTRISEELGFTVCIGISENKLLAKMGGELKKPNATSTLYLSEIEKMWKLPVGDLIMVGRATEPRLLKYGIKNIGDLAKQELEFLQFHFKSHGKTIWEYANGIENTEVSQVRELEKGLGNSTTVHFDVDNETEAFMVLLSLCEMVSMRLRNRNLLAGLVAVSIGTTEFKHYSHQKKLISPTDCTNEIFKYAKTLVREVWKKEPFRKIGISVSSLSPNDNYQISLFDSVNKDKQQKLDKTIDNLRFRYGTNCVFRACFLDNEISAVQGGVGEDGYSMMAGKI